MNALLLGEEAEASASIANTLWRVWTMFTRSAITPPEVNGLGWNLGNSESMVWSCPWQILGAIRVEVASGGRAEISFFCPLNNARFHRLPVGQISRNLHKKTCFREVCGAFGKHLWNLPVRGLFFPKKTFILAWSKSTISDFRNRFLRNDYKSWKVMTGWSPCGGPLLAFHWHRWNELKVIPLACSPRTWRAIFFPKILFMTSIGDDFTACCITLNAVSMWPDDVTIQFEVDWR